MNNTDTIHTLRDAAHEIRALRRQNVEVKAEAYDVLSEIIKRLFGGSQVMSVCQAHQAEKLAAMLENRGATPPPGMNHFCRGESGSGEWSCRSEDVPSRCGYCGEPNEALREQEQNPKLSDAQRSEQ